jgi:hypothetical protein
VRNILQDLHNLLGCPGKVPADVGMRRQLLFEPGLVEPREPRGGIRCQGIEPLLLLRRRIDRHDERPRTRSLPQRTLKRSHHLLTSCVVHPAEKALELVGIRAVLVAEVAITSAVPAAAIDAMGLPDPRQQH